MTVAPAKMERVAADELHVLNRERIRHGLRSQHALAGHLVNALRARADAPERGRTVATLALVAPSDAHLCVRLLRDLARLNCGAAPLLPTHKKPLAVSTCRLCDRVGLDVVMRGRPSSFAIAQDDRLRRFVADACNRLDRTRNVGRLLYDDERDLCAHLFHLPVSEGADRAGQTVFEQD